MGRFVECCCTSVHEVMEAQKGGASRVELCGSLECGGVTPRWELVERVLASCAVPVNVLIRCRPGEFVYDEGEIESMVSDILEFKSMGVNAFVIGALDREGRVDMLAMKRLIGAARPLPVTFHRAFDVCADPLRSFDDIIALGCERLLTSGHESNAPKGSSLIAELVTRANGRICIMAGCGIRPANILELARITRAPEYHSSAHGPSGSTEASVVSALVNL